MSRLDSMIRRLTAQRACLDWVASAIGGVPGPVLEIGLGNGRTYDHLCGRLPDREIHVFDRVIAAHPDSVPPDELLYLGRAGGNPAARTGADRVGRRARACRSRQRPPGARPRRGGPAVATAAAAHAPRRFVLSDQELDAAALAPEPLPDGVPPGRYFVYRRRTGQGSF